MKKIRMNDFKLGSKMIFTLVIPIVSLILITCISGKYIKEIHDQLIKNIYEEAHKSQYWLLNADRDFYQALVGEMNMEVANTPALINILMFLIHKIL